MTCADNLRDLANTANGWPTYMDALPEIAAVIEAAEKVAWNPDEDAGGIVATPTYHLIQVHQALAALSARLDGAS